MSASPETKKQVMSEVSSRDRILDVAEVSFARRGYAGVGMREVAEGVGLGKSSLFHHFRSKADLYSAVCVRILQKKGVSEWHFNSTWSGMLSCLTHVKDA